MNDTSGRSRQKLVGEATRHLSWLLSSEREEGGLSPGEQAELRRADPKGALPPVLWRLLTAPTIAEAVLASAAGAQAENTERAWALLIRTMLEAGTSREARSVGQVLADPRGTREVHTSYAEQRLVRLLRARGLSEIDYEARQAARWCAAQGTPIRFADDRRFDGFGPFLLAAALNREKEADHRAHAIARDYFANMPREARATES